MILSYIQTQNKIMNNTAMNLLKANISFWKEIEILDSIVLRNKVKPISMKIKAIRNYKKPQNLTKLHSFSCLLILRNRFKSSR